MQFTVRSLTLKIVQPAEYCLHAFPYMLAVLLGAALAGRYGGRTETAAALFFLLTLLIRVFLLHARLPLPIGCAIEGAWGCAALAAGYIATGRFSPCPPDASYFLLAFVAFSSIKFLFDKGTDEQNPEPPARSTRGSDNGRARRSARPLASVFLLLVLLAPVLWLWSRYARWYICVALAAIAVVIIAIAFTSAGKRGRISSALILWSLYLGALTLLVRLY